jgi:hypothetical protein
LIFGTSLETLASEDSLVKGLITVRDYKGTDFGRRLKSDYQPQTNANIGEFLQFRSLKHFFRGCHQSTELMAHLRCAENLSLRASRIPAGNLVAKLPRQTNHIRFAERIIKRIFNLLRVH